MFILADYKFYWREDNLYCPELCEILKIFKSVILFIFSDTIHFMGEKLSVTVKKKIHAPVGRVWRALTDPKQIKEYLFGTDTQTDWKKGSPITYTGIWQGKKYQDKGTIIEIIPDRLLHTTYFSSMSGKDDVPGNYANVIYELQPDGPNTTLLILSQDNIDNSDGVRHMEENWNQVLDGLKKLVEGDGAER